jgi:3-methyladenine DNA glycosylase/8-oxoguanine DNA glycosylase
MSVQASDASRRRTGTGGLRPATYLPRDASTAEKRVEVTPPWPFQMPRWLGMDRLTRRRNGVLHRLLHIDGEPVHLRVAVLASGNVLFGARGAHPEAAITAMRRALGVDQDLSEFHRAYRDDPLIGAVVRKKPTLRITGRPDPFEALAFAVTAQLIEYQQAAAIQRRIIRVLGRHHDASDLDDFPDAATLADTSTARFESFELSAPRARALRRVAIEVARGSITLDPAAGEDAVRDGWRRLRQIPGIGAWTVEILAVSGQGRVDQLPAGDLGYLKLVGRQLSGGDPFARAEEAEVRELFERFGEWKGLAGHYALHSAL